MNHKQEPPHQQPKQQQSQHEADTAAKPQSTKISVGQLALSTLAAAVGVQSNKNRERDFAQNSIFPYLLAGLIFTGVFIGGLIFLVNQLLANH